MKRIFAVASVLAVMMTSGAFQAKAEVVNFDDLTGSGPVPSTYGGINWNLWGYYDNFQFPYTPSSGAERVFNFEDVPTFSFVAASVFNGAYFAGPNGISVTFSMYLDNILVATSDTLNLSDLPAFLSSGYAGLVDTVTIASVPGYFVMDDVTYNVAVPGPEAGAGIGALAMGGLAFFMKRRRRDEAMVA